MDSDDIDRITHNISPLTDIHPKRLTDGPWDDEANHRFALTYLTASGGVSTFCSLFVDQSNLARNVESGRRLNWSRSFIVRQSRYLSESVGSNKLAELDLYLRYSRLRIPILEVLGSDAFRVSIAERVAKGSATPPLEVMPDLIAGALAQRKIDRAIKLLESEKDRGAFGANVEIFLLSVSLLLERQR